MRKKIIVMNWKMNPDTLLQAVKIAKLSDKKGIILCPPSIFLREIQKKIKKAKLGAQDCFWEERGAFTGEISPRMLKNSGVEYVILGHSERRNYLKETNEKINKKTRKALSLGLKVILCVGSKKKNETANEEIKIQIKEGLKGITKKEAGRIVIAYEPVWAISTTKNNTVAVPEKTGKDKFFIEKCLNELFKQENGRKIKIIYGGSVDSSNIKSFIEKSKMDGVLVGAASLNPKEIKKFEI